MTPVADMGPRTFGECTALQLWEGYQPVLLDLCCSQHQLEWMLLLAPRPNELVWWATPLQLRLSRFG